MLRHTVLFSRSRVPFAISSHSAANRRNRSDVSIGRPPCSSKISERGNATASERFRPTPHKCYAPHCTLWTNYPGSAFAISRHPGNPSDIAAHRLGMGWIEVLIIGFRLRDYAAAHESVSGPSRPRHSVTFESALRGRAGAPPVSWRGS